MIMKHVFKAGQPKPYNTGDIPKTSEFFSVLPGMLIMIRDGLRLVIVELHGLFSYLFR